MVDIMGEKFLNKGLLKQLIESDEPIREQVFKVKNTVDPN
jgi:hypothetical protein